MHARISYILKIHRDIPLNRKNKTFNEQIQLITIITVQIYKKSLLQHKIQDHGLQSLEFSIFQFNTFNTEIQNLHQHPNYINQTSSSFVKKFIQVSYFFKVKNPLKLSIVQREFTLRQFILSKEIACLFEDIPFPHSETLVV